MATEAIVHPPRTMMEIFKAIPEGTRVQLIQNQLVISPAPSDTHQKIILKIAKKLDNLAEEKDLGEVRIAAYDVYLDEENAFQPDIVFVAKENVYKIQENGLHGAPDLVIEVLSPSNSSYDKKGKKEVYEKAGVKEYFIIEPYEKAVTFYKLVNDEFHEIEQTVGVLRSILLETEITF